MMFNQITPKHSYKKIFLLLGMLISIVNVSGQQIDKKLFQNPTQEFEPKTWMHAMSGNMSKEGLTKDLNSMAEVGIGGLLLFNISQGIPNGAIKYHSEEHHETIAHAAKEAERLGLSFGVHNCDGWSASGGPWITPEQSMKMVVWSEQITNGGKVNLQLSQPTTREGLYQDIAVLAFPSFPMERKIQNVKITSSDPNFDIKRATDGRWDEVVSIEAKKSQPIWIQFEYLEPQTIQSAYIIFTDREGEFELLSSENGKDFVSASKLQKVRTGKGEWAIADQFAPVTSRFFRLKLNQRMSIKEVQLSGIQKIDHLLGRNAMARVEDAALAPIGEADPLMTIKKSRMIDLSANMNSSGLLNTTLPQGQWTIMRFGYTSTSAYNNPASKEGKGLEVDKLNREAFKIHYDAFIKKVVDKSKLLAPNAFQYVEIDSYEMGGQNWTDNFDVIFKERYGYDMKSFLPLIAGRFIEDAEVSEAVLWDYRNLISDLMTENYFGYFTELCHKDGLKSYIEPYGFGPLNDLDVGGKSDIPMGEFWMNRPITMVASAVSSAHIYGKNVISAESFTSNPEINWKGHPAMAKLSGDKAWANGINEFMFHRFAHQANTHVEPGMTMNRWGFHFDRTQTWWNNAGKAWFKYIARGSYLLRLGVPVADLLVFVGDGSPNSIVERNDFKPAIPQGINFDCVNADVLKNRVQVKNGKIVLPEGTTYNVLVLKNVETISLATLKRLYELQQQGVKIVGETPKKLGGYLHSAADQQLFSDLVKSLQIKASPNQQIDWNSILDKSNLKKDFIITGRSDIDFMHRKVNSSDIYFFYNPDSTANTFEVKFNVTGKYPERWNPITGEISRLAQFKQADGYTTIPISLNVEESAFIVFQESVGDKVHVTYSGEKDNADINYAVNNSGQIKAVTAKSGKYQVELSNGKKSNISVKNIPQPIKITNSWDLELADKNTSVKVRLDSLIDWKDYPNDSVRYFSGTGNYTTTFSIPGTYLSKDSRIYLDLGQVAITASVKINGEDLGQLWMPPFVVDVTKAVRSGLNTLQIDVTNQWSNKLIGDERFPANDGGYELGAHGYNPEKMPEWYVNNEPLPAGKRTTFTTAPFYKKNDPLMPSGLKGPVRLFFKKESIITQSK